MHKMDTQRATSIAVHTDTHRSASYQSSLMKSVISAALASQSQRDSNNRRRGGGGIEMEAMACLREEESDGMSSGSMRVKRG